MIASFGKMFLFFSFLLCENMCYSAGKGSTEEYESSMFFFSISDSRETVGVEGKRGGVLEGEVIQEKKYPKEV